MSPAALRGYLAERRRLVERALAEAFPARPTLLRRAIRYSLLAGGKRLRPFLAAEMARHGYRMEDHPLYGESVPHFSPQNAFSAPHILLVGDAIGVDVLYGEGIAPALEYGRLAAEAIVDAGERNDFSFRNYRQRVLQSEMGKALRRRAAFAKTFFRLRSPVIQRWIWGRLSALVRWSTERFLVNWASGEPRGTIRTRNLGSHSEKW